MLEKNHMEWLKGLRPDEGRNYIKRMYREGKLNDSEFEELIHLLDGPAEPLLPITQTPEPTNLKPTNKKAKRSKTPHEEIIHRILKKYKTDQLSREAATIELSNAHYDILPTWAILRTSD